MANKREWSLWMSGLFGGDAILHLILAINNADLYIPKLGVAVDMTWNSFAFVISGIISYSLYNYYKQKPILKTKVSKSRRKR